ncbi:putative adenylyl-sulfate kinase [Andreesenia angusta]|uniref:Adenylyl-sulfate kinase n=1 Tax=Andreesenia angusta TaxID=39480 RepID=A0A1S1V4I1_9FIRM|nr:adenylyl-sulfate kinase [Andreesenia angusta]OHW61532.1 putative adenylyl-sulfate kinase [Andreesenia angusta]
MKNIVWHSGKVDRQRREELLNQKSKLLWFTGLSGSGKSTVANQVEERLHMMGKHTYLLDGDNLRFGLNGDLGFSLEDRRENIRRIAEVGKLFLDSGAITLCTFVSPTREIRDMARDMVGEDFVEIYIKCDLEICAERDPKGLYKKAMSGEIEDFTGLNSPYEEPENPELVLETDRFSAEELAEKVISYLGYKEGENEDS